MSIQAFKLLKCLELSYVRNMSPALRHMPRFPDFKPCETWIMLVLVSCQHLGTLPSSAWTRRGQAWPGRRGPRHQAIGDFPQNMLISLSFMATAAATMIMMKHGKKGRIWEKADTCLFKWQVTGCPEGGWDPNGEEFQALGHTQKEDEY